MRVLALCAALACSIVGSSGVLAGGSVKDSGGAGPPAAGLARGFVAEGQGCYWDWGELRCFSYCYWEIDGRRYCHPRQRHAYPQSYHYYYGRFSRPDVAVQPDYRRYPPVPDYRNAPIYERTRP